MTDETIRFIWTGVFAAIPAVLAFLALNKVGQVKEQTTEIKKSVDGTHTKLEEKINQDGKTIAEYRSMIDKMVGAGTLTPVQEVKAEELAEPKAAK